MTDPHGLITIQSRSCKTTLATFMFTAQFTSFTTLTGATMDSSAGAITCQETPGITTLVVIAALVGPVQLTIMRPQLIHTSQLDLALPPPAAMETRTLGGGLDGNTLQAQQTREIFDILLFT